MRFSIHIYEKQIIIPISFYDAQPLDVYVFPPLNFFWHDIIFGEDSQFLGELDLNLNQVVDTLAKVGTLFVVY